MLKNLTLLLSLLFLSCWPLLSQTTLENLAALESLIDSSLSSIENMERDNETLKKTIENLQASLKTQSLLLREQGKLLNEQEENYKERGKIYETQKQYLAGLLFKSNVYKWSLIIAAPLCTGLGVYLGMMIR